MKQSEDIIVSSNVNFLSTAIFVQKKLKHIFYNFFIYIKLLWNIFSARVPENQSSLEKNYLFYSFFALSLFFGQP